jgi:hypothetical protein
MISTRTDEVAADLEVALQRLVPQQRGLHLLPVPHLAPLKVHPDALQLVAVLLEHNH